MYARRCTRTTRPARTAATSTSAARCGPNFDSASIRCTAIASEAIRRQSRSVTNLGGLDTLEPPIWTAALESPCRRCRAQIQVFWAAAPLAAIRAAVRLAGTHYVSRGATGRVWGGSRAGRTGSWSPGYGRAAISRRWRGPPAGGEAVESASPPSWNRCPEFSHRPYAAPQVYATKEACANGAARQGRGPGGTSRGRLQYSGPG